MRTLVKRGYVRQEASRRYTLGSRLIRLGETSSRMLGTWLRPFLAQLVRLTGETANLAMLDGNEVVYIAQVPSLHQMRMFAADRGAGSSRIAPRSARRCSRSFRPARHARCSSGPACPPTLLPPSPTRTCCSRTSR